MVERKGSKARQSQAKAEKVKSKIDSKRKRVEESPDTSESVSFASKKTKKSKQVEVKIEKMQGKITSFLVEGGAPTSSKTDDKNAKVSLVSGVSLGGEATVKCALENTMMMAGAPTQYSTMRTVTKPLHVTPSPQRATECCDSPVTSRPLPLISKLTDSGIAHEGTARLTECGLKNNPATFRRSKRHATESNLHNVPSFSRTFVASLGSLFDPIANGNCGFEAVHEALRDLNLELGQFDPVSFRRKLHDHAIQHQADLLSMSESCGWLLRFTNQRKEMAWWQSEVLSPIYNDKVDYVNIK